MKIYTRTGDTGDTALFGGGRVVKSHLRVEAMGGVDELNASLGWAVTQLADGPARDRLESLQHELFAIGAELATPRGPDSRTRPTTPDFGDDRVAALESWIDEMDRELTPLRAFVLPGGTAGAAALHLARTVCRRAERAVVRLDEAEKVRGTVIAYLNRLSDLLFTLARVENRRAGRGDVEWRKG
ncbi:MAG: cob(I)yrinic acid a,c-diamide adenosyltransferase [Longimicrobiales bacterium]